MLRAGGGTEVGIADRAVYSKICPVERIESVGAKLQAHAASITRRPYIELLDQRDVVHQNRWLPELAVVLRGCSERELSRNRKGCGVEIEAGRIVRIERCAALVRPHGAAVGIAHPRVGERRA